MSFQQENTPYVFFKKSISPRNWNTGSPSGNTKTPLKKKKTFYGLCASLSDKSILFAPKTHFPLVISPSKKHQKAAVWPIPCGRRLPSPPTASACWHQWFAVAPASSADRLWRPRSKLDTWSSRAPGRGKGRFQRNPRTGGIKKTDNRVNKGLIVGLCWLLVSLLRRFRTNNCFESRFKGAAWSSAEVFVSCSDIQYWKPTQQSQKFPKTAAKDKRQAPDHFARSSRRPYDILDVP